MIKRIFAVVFLLLLFSLIAFFLYHFKTTKQTVGSAIRAIPRTTAFIIETKKSHESFQKLSQTNIIWEELLSVAFVNKLDSQIKFFDSLFVINPLVKEIFDGQSLFISAHITAEKHFNFLFLFNISPSVAEKTIADISAQISQGFTKNEKEYDGASMVTYSSTENHGPNSFSYSVYRGIFIGSVNEMLVEDAIRQINSGNSLHDDFAFNKVASTSGEKADMIFFINHKFFPTIINSFTLPAYSSSILSLKNFADWTALDLKIKPNILMLNGFTYSNDTVVKFLNFFKNQKPQEAAFTEILPSNTAAFIHYGFSNFLDFYREYSKFQGKEGREEKIRAIAEDCHCDPEKSMLSWIENEIALVITEPLGQNGLLFSETEESKSKTPEGNFFVILKSNNVAEAKRLLNFLSDSLFENKTDSISPKIEIKKLKIPEVFPVFPGALFFQLQPNYYTVIEDYVIFSEEVGPLKNFSSHYFAEKTFSGKLNYRAFSENLSSESNIFIYSNIGHSFSLLSRFLNPGYLMKLEENKELFRKFETVAIQFSNDNNQLFYNNIFLKYNPVTKQEISTLWETRLDTAVISSPMLLTNHYTQAREILVQDVSNTIYLISGTGKILWKRPLPEKIIGRVKQIDALKNNKLQMLFNTSSYIFLIDRNGKEVNGFPIKLKTGASNELSLMDYEGNKNYRILISLNDHSVRNFELNRMEVKGWEFPKTISPVKQPIQYFSLEGKDYLVAIDESGNIYITDRTGKSRMNIKAKIPLSKNNSFFIEPGKNISKTRIVATDSTGNVIRLYLGGNIENIKIEDFSENHFFAYRDINNDKSAEYIFLDKNKIFVFAQDKLRYSIFNYSFEANIHHSPLFFEYPDNSMRIGVNDSESGKIFLFDETGQIPESFPLYGSTPFTLGDLNKDGELYLVTASGNSVYTYLLKK